MRCACAVLYCHLWPVWLYQIFLHCLKNDTIFKGKKLLNIKCVFWYFIQLLAETFLINWARYGKKMYIDLHLKYSLFFRDFNKTLIFSTDFRILLKYKISWKSIQWELSLSVRTDGQTDVHDEANSRLSQFCKTRKNYQNQVKPSILT